MARVLYGPEPAQVEHWVEDQRERLYTGRAVERVTGLTALQLTLSARAKRDAGKRDALSDLIGSLDKRLSMMAYKDLIEGDMVIASGMVEGAARYVVGERLDCRGMRWIPERAEALLHLRCIELNGDWERFFAWGYHRWLDQMQAGQRVLIRSNQAEPLPTGASIEATDCQGLEPSQRAKAA